MTDTSPPAGSDESMRRYYAARAGEYDLVYAKPERQADIARLRAWLPARFDGSRVLDVAAGTGFWTECFAPVAREVVLVDAADETLARARSRLPPGNAKFVVGDAYRLPPDLGLFDAAFVGFWFSHVPRERRREFIAGLVPFVRPEGLVVLVDNRYPGGVSHPISETDRMGNTYQARRLADGSAHRILKNFPSVEELEAAVSGFASETSSWSLTCYWTFTFKVARREAHS
jgi:demethylmenaquinone methyltransferase/2-methoxy-6-polyprenyl-1,4-benzoquinol methylase